MIDISGQIYNGMWNYEAPFPRVNIRPLPRVSWVETPVYCDIFDGLHSQTGTYLETPAHLLGDASYMLADVPIERIMDVPAVVLKLSGFPMDGIRRPVCADALRNADGISLIAPGDAVLVSTDWGKHWRRDGFLPDSPYFTRDAMEFLISLKPGILGTDFPRWENMDEPQGFFPMFYNADILMLAPCVNLERADLGKMHLAALPLNVPDTCCAPVRAVLW
ncbi:MAG: cyclase family protein [Oscillospiraceae bacterium]